MADSVLDGLRTDTVLTAAEFFKVMRDVPTRDEVKADFAARDDRLLRMETKLDALYASRIPQWLVILCGPLISLIAAHYLFPH